jgi:hypothetical protein
VKSVEDVEAFQFEGRKRLRAFIGDSDRISDGTFSGDGLGNPCADAIVSQHATEIRFRQFGGYVAG